MYRCDECETLFTDPVTALKESTVPYGVCPNCGADIYEEVAKCDICGEWREIGEVTEMSGQLVCDTCAGKIREVIGQMAARSIEAVAEAYGIAKGDVRELLKETLED